MRGLNRLQDASFHDGAHRGVHARAVTAGREHGELHVDDVAVVVVVVAKKDSSEARTQLYQAPSAETETGLGPRLGLGLGLCAWDIRDAIIGAGTGTLSR